MQVVAPLFPSEPIYPRVPPTTLNRLQLRTASIGMHALRLLARLGVTEFIITHICHEDMSNTGLPLHSK